MIILLTFNDLSLCIISGLLITGGEDTNRSVEVWAPGPGSTPFSCYLPATNRGRESHTLTGSGLACGGFGDWGDLVKAKCELWSNGGWVELEDRFYKERYGHCAWLERSTNTTFLLGGPNSSRRSIETVSSVGDVAQADLTLKHDVK